MRNTLLQPRRLLLFISLFCVLLIFLVWRQILDQTEADRKTAIHNAVQRNENLVISLEQFTIRTIKNADALLQLVRLEFQRSKGNVNLKELVNKGVIETDFINGVVLLDSTGKMVSTDMDMHMVTETNFSDRAYFYHHKDVEDELYISTPLESRTLGKAVIALSRRINLPDGSFGGVVAVQILTPTLTRFYANANLNDLDIISLIAPNGTTYARRTGSRESYGENIIRSPLFTLVKEKAVSSYVAKDAIRGVPTYFSYRKLADYPIIATVGTAEKDVFDVWGERRKRDFLYGAILSVLLVLFFGLVYYFWAKQRRKDLQIRENEHRYRSIFENSQDAIIITDPHCRVMEGNPAAHRLFERKIMKGEALCELFLGSTEPISVESGLEGVKMQEVTISKKDGSEVTGELVHSSFSNEEISGLNLVLIRNISVRKEMEQKLLREQKRYQRMLTRQIILAQEREREGIGHELHDNVNQILTTVKLYLEMAASETESRKDLIGRSVELVMQCITEIRQLSRELSAPTLGTHSLLDSTHALIEMVQTASGVRIYFEHESYTLPVDKDSKLALYRILQEQLNNIVKHAKASEVKIVLKQEEGKTILIISDNGKGFDTRSNSRGIGLNNIRSRVKAFGGNINIETSVGNGCRMVIEMPMIGEKSEVDS